MKRGVARWLATAERVLRPRLNPGKPHPAPPEALPHGAAAGNIPNLHPLLLDTALLQTAAYFDLSDPKERRRSAAILRELTVGLHALIKPGAIFEIGAHEATFSKAVRRHAPGARILAFEASPHVYELYRTQPELRELGIEYQHRAISERSGTTTFHVVTRRNNRPISPDAESHSLLQRTKNAEYEPVTVPCSTLEDIIEAEGLRDVISTAWIDVEGALEYVFSGIGDRIRQFQLLHCEVEDFDKWQDQWKSHDVFSFLMGHGFVPVARDFEARYQYNVLFLSSSALRSANIRLAIAEHYSLLGNRQPARLTS